MRARRSQQYCLRLSRLSAASFCLFSSATCSLVAEEYSRHSRWQVSQSFTDFNSSACPTLQVPERCCHDRSNSGVVSLPPMRSRMHARKGPTCQGDPERGDSANSLPSEDHPAPGVKCLFFSRPCFPRGPRSASEAKRLHVLIVSRLPGCQDGTAISTVRAASQHPVWDRNGGGIVTAYHILVCASGHCGCSDVGGLRGPKRKGSGPLTRQRKRYVINTSPRP